jgi:hypothetical protein
MQKSDTYAPQIQAMITTKPGEFSYCYAADTVHAIATCDAQSSKAPDTPEVCPTLALVVAYDACSPLPSTYYH